MPLLLVSSRVDRPFLVYFVESTLAKNYFFYNVHSLTDFNENMFSVKRIFFSSLDIYNIPTI